MAMVRIGLLLLAAACLGAGPAMAAGQTFTATLDGASQVPKVDTKASGEVTFAVAPDGKTIAYTLTVRDLTDVNMAHVHLGLSGNNGPVVVWLYPASGKPKLVKGVENGQLAKGEISAASLQGPEKGKPLAALVQAMKDGDAYVNVHTVEHKAGEIRGQIK
jgi:hypothetical protein